ncbi:methyltransferase [Sphingobium sp.]|uniref:methyltransferase n=1 Tax=Sphingobium sp. TaxID=1912891 RepID=UPI0028BE3392|nr:methyltransferase [Sphingobium sp.]
MDAEVAEFWRQVVPRWSLGELLFFVAERRIADAIGDGASIAEVARATGTHPVSLHRVLRVLAVQGIFTELGDDRYGPSALSAPLLSDHPESQRAYIALGHLVMNPAWQALAGTMETGKPAFDLAFGASSFEYMKDHPAMASAFAEGMSATTRRIEAALIEADPFGAFSKLVDVGGSFGSLARLLLTHQPEATGIVFDRPEIAARAEQNWKDDPVASRLSAVGGNFFEAVPAGGDLYLIKQILHDWDDEQAIAILRCIRAAVTRESRLAVVEYVLPEEPVPHSGWMYDMLMMTVTGGRERSASAYRRLLEKSGFEVTQVCPTRSPASVINAEPV